MYALFEPEIIFLENKLLQLKPQINKYVLVKMCLHPSQLYSHL